MGQLLDIMPGIYPDISWEQYQQIPYVSPSKLKHGLKSMKRLKRVLDGNAEDLEPSEKTTAVGRAVHAMVAGQYQELCAEMPAYQTHAENVATAKKRPSKIYRVHSNTPTVAGQKWLDELAVRGLPADHAGDIMEQSDSKSTSYYQDSAKQFREDHAGKTVLTEIEAATAKKVMRHINGHADAKEAISGSQHEVTIIAQIEGIPCKTRMDGLKPAEAAGWDLKIDSQSVDGSAFYRKAKRMGYLFQFGFHLEILRECPDGFELQKYDCIAAEDFGDYDVACYGILPNGDLLDNWGQRVRQLLADLKQAQGQDYWPGVAPHAIPLPVPSYDMMAADEAYDWETSADAAAGPAAETEAHPW